MVKAECTKREILRCDYRFTRRQAREYTATGNTQLRLHLDRLVEMEYLVVHRGRRGQSFVYELLYDGEGKAGELFVLGLMNVEKLDKHFYDVNLAGQKENLAGPKRAQNAPKTGGWRGSVNADGAGDDPDFGQKSQNTTYRDSLQKPVVVAAASYVNIEAKGE